MTLGVPQRWAVPAIFTSTFFIGGVITANWDESGSNNIPTANS